MKTEINQEFVAKYFNVNKRHKNYYKSIDIADHLSFHIEGYFKQMYWKDQKGQTQQSDRIESENPYFTRLIDTQRPQESSIIKDYRRQIYIPVTKATCFRVLNSLKKIVKSEDWKIDFSKSIPDSKIQDKETLQEYTENYYPFYDNLENWIVNVFMKRLLSDPNGIICVLPVDYEIETNEYLRPYSYIIDSKNVYDYSDGEYVVFLSDKKTKYIQDGKEYEGDILTIITKEEVWEARQTTYSREFKLVMVFEHKIGFLPAWQLGGFPLKISEKYPLWESFIGSMLPSLDKAARESSDLDVSIVQNLFPTMWYIAGDDCPACQGIGKVPGKAKQSIVCPQCGGKGVMLKSPSKDMVIKLNSIGDGKIPIPPADYIKKDTEIIKIQAQRIKDHIKDALDSINMGFLDQTPLSQSGIAKSIDRDELNNFVYGIAYHIVVNILENIYFFINEFRYSLLIQNFDERQKMLPRLNVPQTFDLITETIMSEQLKDLKAANADPIIINQAELDYVNKKFYNEPEVRDKIKSVKELDPFPTKTEQEINDDLLSGTILKEDAILSKYIYPFIERAVEEDKEFLNKTRKEKLIILMSYVQEKVDSMKPIKQAPIIPSKK